MLKCEVGTEKGSIVAQGSTDDIAVDIAYIVARVYNTVKMQSAEGAEELRVNLLTLMAPGSPVWEAPEGHGKAMCVMIPKMEGTSDGA